MGSNLNRYHNYPVEIVSITVLSIGGLSGLTFIVMFIVHLNSRNNGRLGAEVSLSRQNRHPIPFLLQ